MPHPKSRYFAPSPIPWPRKILSKTPALPFYLHVQLLTNRVPHSTANFNWRQSLSGVASRHGSTCHPVNLSVYCQNKYTATTWLPSMLRVGNNRGVAPSPHKTWSCDASRKPHRHYRGSTLPGCCMEAGFSNIFLYTEPAILSRHEHNTDSQYSDR